MNIILASEPSKADSSGEAEERIQGIGETFQKIIIKNSHICLLLLG